VFGVLAAVLFASAAALAQVETGQIGGTVTDQSGAIVTGASVAVKNLSTNAERKTQTSSTGAYSVVGLTPATYQVTVSSGSFQPFKANVEVTVGARVTLDAKLSVSAGTVEVEVVGEGGTQVNTQTQEISQVVDEQQLLQLPSLTRNPYDFVALSGNVSSGDSTGNSAGGGGQNLTARGVGFAINGQRESGTEILLDGVENVSVFSDGVGEDVPVDAVQEYSVITNNFSAEYGRASGGVVNVTTKPGSNKIHGSGWEYNRLSAYTANTYGNVVTGAPKGTYTRNQFGYEAGGPILKDKLFIFESTEWTRVRSSANETEEVFDPAFLAMMPTNLQSYFSTYGGGVLPSTGVAATVADLAAKGYPVGSVNGTTPVPATTPVFDTVQFSTPFDAGGGIPENQYTLVGRLDYNPTSRTSMFFRGARENEDQFPGSAFYSAYPQYDVGTGILNQSYLYSLSHTFGQSVFLSAKASFTRFNTANSFKTSLTSTPSLMFVAPTDPVTGQVIQMPGLENASDPGGGGLPYGGPQNTIQAEPDLSWTKGKHSMRFGGTFTYLQLNEAYGAYAQSVEQLGKTFQGSLNNMMNVQGNPGGSELHLFESRVDPQGELPCLDDVYQNVIQTPGCTISTPLAPAVYARSYRYKDWAFYGQDSFKITPKLTFNFGVRYEHYGVQHNNNPNLDSNFYFGTGTGIEAQTRTGQVYIANQSPVGQFWKPSWGTVGPRVGFAYDFSGNGRASIRGGYGMSYERNFGNVTFNASFNPPASAVIETTPCVDQTIGAAPSNCSTSVVTNNLGPLGVSGTTAPLPPVELRMPDPNIHTAQTQFWSLDLQHQIARGTVIDVGYSGARGLHLYDIENIDQYGAAQYYLGDPLVTDPTCPFENIDTGAPECLTRPNQQYSSINMRGSLGQSSYNGLNIGFQTQNLFGSGLTLATNYTWSHSLDDLSSTFGDSLQGGSGDLGSLGYTDLLHPSIDWGPSDFDIRQRFSVAPIWNLPWFNKHGSYFEREALGGWTVSSITTVRTGSPFSVFDESTVEIGYTIPRLIPASKPTYHTGTPVNVGPNNFVALNIPPPAFSNSLNPALGMSDLGPFPSTMTGRNAFRGPGAWNSDIALQKNFPITERVGLEFHAEGFDIFNHHNYYVNTTQLVYTGGADSTPLQVPELKGGLGTLATGGNHDERRFGQFAVKVTF
jgi:outer membrane receptor protein involved in Fe transport